jgi:hypothetical protein
MPNDNTLKNIQVYSGDPNDPKNLIYNQPLKPGQRELNINFDELQKNPSLAAVQNAPALSPTSRDLAALQSPAVTPIRGTPQAQPAQLPATQAQNQLPAVNQPDNRPWWRKAIDGVISAGKGAINWIKSIFQNGKEFLFGTPDQYEQIPTKTDAENAFLDALIADSFHRIANPSPLPEAIQENALERLDNPYRGFPGTENVLPNALQNLQNPLAGFDPYEKAALKHYQEQTIPSLLESFSGATTSPYIQQHLKNSAQGLETMLNAQRAQYGQQNRQQSLAEAGFGAQFGFENRDQALRQLQLGSQIGQSNRQLDQTQAQLAMTPRFTTNHIPGSPGLIKTATPIAAKAATAYATGMI